MRYMLITYLRKPGGKIDEQVEVSRNLKPKDKTNCNVILDFVEKKVEKKKLKSFKSTVRNMAAVPCPVCNDIHAGACPQDGRMPFDPLSSVGVQNG